MILDCLAYMISSFVNRSRDNVTTSVCCEQLSLKTQPVLSIMSNNL